MSGKRVATSFLAAAMAVGTLSSAAFAENGTVDPADLNWEKPEETINISVYAGEGDQEEFLADENGGIEEDNRPQVSLDVNFEHENPSKATR